MADETSFESLLSVLVDANVSFVLIGGIAAMAHGSARATLDIDVVYDRADDNLDRLVAALEDHNPYLRGAPPDLPFVLDKMTLESGLNFTLTTSLGDIDLLGEVIGGGSYGDLIDHTQMVRIFGRECLCVSLAKLIQLKRAAGRPKDFEAIAELEILLEQQQE